MQPCDDCGEPKCVWKERAGKAEHDRLMLLCGVDMAEDLRAVLSAQLERVTKERDEARDALNRKGMSCAPDLDMMRLLARAERAEAAHDLMAAEKERAEHAHNELVLSLPAMRRDVAERPREACAGVANRHYGDVAEYVRATPLVTDGGGE